MKAVLLCALIALAAADGIFKPEWNLTNADLKKNGFVGIVNGRDTRPNEWRGVVMVIGNNGDCGSTGLCTGAFIHPDVVLTAGHCCDVGATKAICGGTDRPGTKLGQSKAMNRQVAGANDFCLLHVEREPHTTDQDVIYELDNRPVVQQDAIIVGYGVSNSGSPQLGAGRRRDGIVATSGNAGTGVDIRVVNRPGTTPWQNACNGDSGGPLFVEKDGQWVIAGVTSRGSFQCPQGGTAIYTSIVFGTNANAIVSSTRSWLGVENTITPGACAPGQQCCHGMVGAHC